MDDDLLGGPSTSAPPAMSFDDDLLGGPAGASTSAAAFDDDLLFGGPPASGPSSSGPAKTASSAQGGTVGGNDQFAERSAAVPLNISTVKEVPQALTSLVDENTFFLRHLMQVCDDGARVRVVTKITRTTIDILYEQTLTVQHSVPVESIIGIVTQSVLVPKLLTKEFETQAVVQVAGERDLHLGFPREQGTDSIVQFTNVISAISSALGFVLPICTLTNKENLLDHFQRVWVDPRVRRTLVETLAYRSELTNELSAVTKEDSKLEHAIMEIKESSDKTQVIDTVASINELEMLVNNYRTKSAEVAEITRQVRAQLTDVQAALAKEKERREQAVANAVEDKQKQRLLKQVADYEVAKAAHKRELDRIAAVTALYERRARDRRQDVYNASEVVLRLDDLEEQLEDIQGRLSARGDDHSRRVKALAENRKRSAQAKDIIAQLKADIEELEAARDDEDLPARLTSTEVPDLAPVVAAGAAKAPPAGKSEYGPPPAKSTPAPQPQQQKQAQPAPKPAVVSLSDDDI